VRASQFSVKGVVSPESVTVSAEKALERVYAAQIGIAKEGFEPGQFVPVDPGLSVLLFSLYLFQPLLCKLYNSCRLFSVQEGFYPSLVQFKLYGNKRVSVIALEDVYVFQ